MRQGETAHKGHWQGKATGGVEAPDPIVLPNPAHRFAATADRLESLAKGHPMAGWLTFIAGLSRAQLKVCGAALDLPVPTSDGLKRAIGAHLPPLAADGHLRAGGWRSSLDMLLKEMAAIPAPPQVNTLTDSMRRAPADALEALAGAFLSGSIAAEDAGPAVFMAAALQVYFTLSAAKLQVAELRLLPERGLCPCCGSLPSSGFITAAGKTPGTRYLACSLCSTAWNHVRAMCVTCGSSKDLELQSIEGSSGAVVGETCPSCKTYAKMLYQSKDMQLDPYADDLGSLALDLMLAEAGWSRHAPNPLVLVG